MNWPLITVPTQTLVSHIRHRDMHAPMLIPTTGRRSFTTVLHWKRTRRTDSKGDEWIVLLWSREYAAQRSDIPEQRATGNHGDLHHARHRKRRRGDTR